MAASKVVAQLSLLTIPLRFEKATDDPSSGSDTHTVCAGGPGKCQAHLDQAKPPKDCAACKDAQQPHDPVRVKQTVTCPTCGKEASSHYGFPLRGTENAEGKMVVLTEEEIKAAKGVPVTGNVTKGAPPISIRFHSREKVLASTLPAGSVYNVTPDKGGEKGYTLIRDHLRNHPDEVAVTIWATRSVNQMWVIEAVDNRLVAVCHCWPELVRIAPAVADVALLDEERAMFEVLAASLRTDFDPNEYVNTSRLGLQELIASRSGDAVPIPVGTAPVPSAGGDMLSLLQAAVAAAKPEPPTAVPDTGKPAPRKRAAKKTATPLPKTA